MCTLVLRLNGKRLDRVNEVHYLGVTISSDLYSMISSCSICCFQCKKNVRLHFPHILQTM